MPFGSLTGAQQILIKLFLRGGPQFRSELAKSGFAVDKFAVSEAELAKAMAVTNKRTFLHNQLMFMARRGLFYATLGVVGLGVGLVKLGLQYENTMQQATIAFKGFLGGEAAAKKELQDLYVIAAESPFEFPDIVMATRRLLPFTSGVKETNTVIKALVDGLSGMGVITGAALNRAAFAMSHMYNMGVLTGQVLTQLNRDNVPMLKALMYYFHATGEEIHDSVGDKLISATEAAKALTAYMQTPGFKGAAFEQATKTLAGGIATFKDILRIAMGRSEHGMFESLTLKIQAIDKALLPLIEGKKPITLENIAKVIDAQVSPATHALFNAFIFGQAFLKALIGTLYVFLKVLQFVLWPIDKLGNLFGSAGLGAKILGTALGILTGLFLINRTATMLNVIATEAYALKQIFLRDAIMKTVAAQKLQNLWATKGMETGIGKMLFGKKMTTAPVALPKSYDARVARGEIPGVSPKVGGAAEKVGERTGGLFKKMSVDVSGFGSTFKSAADKIKATKLGTNLRLIAYSFKEGGWKVGLRALGTGIMGIVPALGAATAASVAFFLANIWWFAIAAAIVAVIVAIVVLYRKWDAFHYLVQDTFEWIKKHWQMLTWFIPVIGPIIFVVVQIISHFKTWWGWIMKIIDKIMVLVGWVKKIGGFFGRIGHTIARPFKYVGHNVKQGAQWAVTEDVKERAAGGPIFRSGPVLVGEKGPELVMLPGGANVIPNDRLTSSRVEPIGLRDRASGGDNDKPIVVQVMLDRKVLAEGVARANQDYAARR